MSRPAVFAFICALCIGFGRAWAEPDAKPTGRQPQFALQSIKASNAYKTDWVMLAFRPAGDVLACYGDALGRSPNLRGKTNAKLVIDADGKVTDATTSGFNAKIDPCVAKAVRALAFTKPSDGKPVTLTLVIEFSSYSDADQPAMIGNTIGDAYGKGGLGLAGDGAKSGTIGLGTIGHSSGTGSGYGTGHGAAGRPPAPSSVWIADVTVDGALDKAIVRRILKRNLAQLSGCADALFKAKPTTDGIVTATFTIRADGSVTGAAASGLDKAVAACAAKLIGSLSFPKPADGDAKVSAQIRFEPVVTAKPAAPADPTP